MQMCRVQMAMHIFVSEPHVERRAQNCSTWILGRTSIHNLPNAYRMREYKYTAPLFFVGMTWAILLSFGLRPKRETGCVLVQVADHFQPTSTTCLVLLIRVLSSSSCLQRFGEWLNYSKTFITNVSRRAMPCAEFQQGLCSHYLFTNYSPQKLLSTLAGLQQETYERVDLYLCASRVSFAGLSQEISE